MFNRCISNSFFVPTIEKKVFTVEEALNNLSKLYHILKSDGIIAVPTDTVYGLACLASNKTSVEKLHKIKTRKIQKPISICLSSLNDVKKWSHVNVNDNCLSTLLPGPVTLIFNRRITLTQSLNPGVPSIGVRIPNNKFIIELSRYCDEPIALTSANTSNEPNPLHIHEFESLWNDIDLVVDNGELGNCEDDPRSRSGSTVIDLTVPGTYKILREGTHYEHTIKLLEKNCKLIRRKV